MTDTAASEAELVVAAVRNYFEGWYDSDVERMERALHDDLVKRGPSLGLTTKARMLDLTAQGEGAEDGIDRTLEIRVEDLYGTIANVTVESAVYQEYVHLVRTADGWKIVNTLWRPRHADAPD